MAKTNEQTSSRGWNRVHRIPGKSTIIADNVVPLFALLVALWAPAVIWGQTSPATPTSGAAESDGSPESEVRRPADESGEAGEGQTSAAAVRRSTAASVIGAAHVATRSLVTDPNVRAAESALRTGDLNYRRVLAEREPNLTLGPGAGGTYALTTTENGVRHGFGVGLEYVQELPTAGHFGAALGTSFSYEAANGSPTSLTQSPVLTVNVAQPVFLNDRFIDLDLFVAPARIEEANIVQARIDLLAASNRAILDSLVVYYRTLAALYRLQSLRATSDVAAEDLRIMKVRAAQGLLTNAEVWAAELRVQGEEDAVFVAEIGFLEQSIALARVLGSDASVGETELPTLSDAVPPEVSSPAVTDSAIAGRAADGPTLGWSPTTTLSADLAVERLMHQIQLEGRQFASRLDVALSFAPQYAAARTGTDFGASFADFFAAGAWLEFGLGVSLTVPLTAGRYRLIQEASQADRIARTTEARQRERSWVADTVALLDRRIAVADERTQYWRSQVELSQRQLAESERLLELGNITAVEIQRAELLVQQRRTEAWWAAVDRFLLILQRQSALGLDLREELGITGD